MLYLGLGIVTLVNKNENSSRHTIKVYTLNGIYVTPQ